MIDRPLSRVDLTDIARDVIADHVAQAAAHDVDLGLARSGAAAPVTVNGDDASLRTLLSNLVDNALRYTPPGGRVDVAVAVDGNAASLSVHDSGPGIPPTEHTRVFDRFYRAPGSADLPGSGLGLAIVQRIAERHGATIALGPGIASHAGPGLGVTVRFPAAVDLQVRRLKSRLSLRHYLVGEPAWCIAGANPPFRRKRCKRIRSSAVSSRWR